MLGTENVRRWTMATWLNNFIPFKTQFDGEKNRYHALYKILQKSSNIFYIKYMLNYLRYSQAMLQNSFQHAWFSRKVAMQWTSRGWPPLYLAGQTRNFVKHFKNAGKKSAKSFQTWGQRSNQGTQGKVVCHQPTWKNGIRKEVWEDRGTQCKKQGPRKEEMVDMYMFNSTRFVPFNI